MFPASLRGLSLCRDDCGGHDRNLLNVTLLASAARAASQRRVESRATAGKCCEDDRPAVYGWQGTSVCGGLATVNVRDFTGDLGIHSDS
jgi:hypothetical protein